MHHWLVALVPLTLLAPACFNPADPDEADDQAMDGSGETDTGGDAAPSCAEYCGLVNDHCEGDLAQYSGSDTCESTCALIPPGTADDQLGNTVGCRIFHSLLAAEQPDPHCLHAGPSGDGTCGASCENFCAIALGACTGDNSVWPNAEACLADCQMFNPEPPYSASQNDADTFSCRMFHATLASLQPDLHCGHIALVSPVCQ